MKDMVQAGKRRELVLAALASAFPDWVPEVREVPVDEVVISLPALLVVPAVQVLVDQLGIVHLSTITGDDTGEYIRLLYHFWDRTGITLETLLPLDAPRIETLTALIPGATFYEREVFEMFGVVFEGHPDLRPLLLPEDWAEGPPMRKAVKREQERQI